MLINSVARQVPLVPLSEIKIGDFFQYVVYIYLKVDSNIVFNTETNTLAYWDVASIKVRPAKQINRLELEIQ